MDIQVLNAEDIQVHEDLLAGRLDHYGPSVVQVRLAHMPSWCWVCRMVNDLHRDGELVFVP
jgi:hypothetical protein